MGFIQHLYESQVHCRACAKIGMFFEDRVHCATARRWIRQTYGYHRSLFRLSRIIGAV